MEILLKLVCIIVFSYTYKTQSYKFMLPLIILELIELIRIVYLDHVLNQMYLYIIAAFQSLLILIAAIMFFKNNPFKKSH